MRLVNGALALKEGRIKPMMDALQLLPLWYELRSRTSIRLNGLVAMPTRHRLFVLLKSWRNFKGGGSVRLDQIKEAHRLSLLTRGYKSRRKFRQMTVTLCASLQSVAVVLGSDNRIERRRLFIKRTSCMDECHRSAVSHLSSIFPTWLNSQP